MILGHNELLMCIENNNTAGVEVILLTKQDFC